MTDRDIAARIDALTTPHIADGCIRAGVPVRCAPAGTAPTVAGSRVFGRVLPARHAGSVDVFLEAIERFAAPGDVLLVDNGGRTDEACVGDLVVLEAERAGLTGVVIWGLHRDTGDIRGIGMPVFSLGALPTGPLSLRELAADALTAARVGSWTVSSTDLVVGDDDGVLFIPADRAEEVVARAESVRDVERSQADRIRAGDSLREQLDFAGYLARRALEPSLTFRDHLRSIGGAIEE